MKLSRLFRRVLDVEYRQMEENAASYRAQRRGDVLFLFFEKSNGAVDWKNNFDFPAKPYREMRDLWFVHGGFLRVFKTIEREISPLIADETVKRIVIAGYSHGAALALLCHEYCVFHRPDLVGRIRGIGYGCPRVVWGIPGKRVRARFSGFTVVRDGNDLVTHLPPVLFGFRHVGNLIRLTAEGVGPIDAHRPENYLRALGEAEL